MPDKKISNVPQPGELFEDAFYAVLSLRRLNHQGNKILAPGEPGYSRDKPKIYFASREFVSLIAGGDAVLATKLRHKVNVAKRCIDPVGILLSNDELEAVAPRLKLSDTEKARLKEAHENTVEYIVSLVSPEMQNARIQQVLQSYTEGSLLAGSARSKAESSFTALQAMLIIRGIAATDTRIADDWKTVTKTIGNPEKRGAALDRIAAVANLQDIPGMDAFKEAVIAEKATGVKHGGALTIPVNHVERLDSPTTTLGRD